MVVEKPRILRGFFRTDFVRGCIADYLPIELDASW
jgi:hypothetical protein